MLFLLIPSLRTQHAGQLASLAGTCSRLLKMVSRISSRRADFRIFSLVWASVMKNLCTCVPSAAALIFARRMFSLRFFSAATYSRSHANQ